MVSKGGLNRKAKIAMIILVLIVIGAIIGNSIFHKPKVTVTAVDLSIIYQTNSGYLGPTSQSLEGFTADAGTKYAYSITFHSSAILLTHKIERIYVNTSSFSIISISPQLPYSFGPGSTFTITIIFQLPSNEYTGVLNLVIVTT